MRDNATDVRRLLLDPAAICAGLGLLAGSKPASGGLSIRCPAHDDHDPSCSVRIGQDGTIQVKCHACEFAGDALHLIGAARGLDTGDSSDFREVLAIGAELAGDLGLAEEIRTGRSSQGRRPVPPPPEQTERVYPDQSEVVSLWESAGPCDVDMATSKLLRARSICPIAATQRGLGRVLDHGTPCPAWASSNASPWPSEGYRLIVPVFDSAGKFRSVRAWQVDSLTGPKRKPPSGKKAAGLVMANREAVMMLAGKAKPTEVVVCEGEPDWMTWATRVDESVAVIGIGSGSWSVEFANRLPKGCRVFVRTHCDPAGDKYAAHVLETIGERCETWRLDASDERNKLDENDKAKAGLALKDTQDGCLPANAAAKRAEENRPRVFTVREMMQVAHKALATDEPPLMWTSGHWKIDLMTGGLRPDSGWVIGGASNWGKSMFLISMCDENMRSATNPTVPLIVSGEDSEELYAQRLLARRARVNAMRLRDNCLKPDEHKRIALVMKESEMKPHYLDGRGVTFERLMNQILELVAKRDIRIVALDYVQEFRTKQKYESERVMFREMARVYRHSLKRAKCGSIVLTQLTSAEKGKAPNKDNIRECKDIGHGAEVIGMGWEPEETVTDQKGAVLYEAGSKLMILDKTKSGAKGAVKMDWDPVSACFNRVQRPYGYQDDDTKRYDADADTEHAMCGFDEFDAAIAGYDDQFDQSF